MNLSTFKTIEEKSSAYEYTQVYSFTDLIFYLRLVSHNNPQNTYFRGQADGSWKLYSSMQREWLTRELYFRYSSYPEIISKFLNYIKEYNSTQLRNFCKIVTDISIFSTLQHYGAPTPFVDWTSDYKVALFFATHKSNELCVGNETNSFVSVYWLNVGDGTNNQDNDLTRFSQMLEQHKANMQVIIAENGKIPGSFYANATRFGIWKDIDALWMEESNDDFMKISNPRADLQSGAFVYTKDNQKSLDEIFTGEKISDDDCEGGTLLLDDSPKNCFIPTSTPSNVDKTPKAAPLCLPKIHCIDIHKSVVPQIKKFLQDRNITMETLGLNTDDWGQKAFQSFLEEYPQTMESDSAMNLLNQIEDDPDFDKGWDLS